MKAFEIEQNISLEECEEIMGFCEEQLKEKQPRHDYKEFLELVVLFLGGNITSSLKVPEQSTTHDGWQKLFIV